MTKLRPLGRRKTKKDKFDFSLDLKLVKAKAEIIFYFFHVLKDVVKRVKYFILICLT